MNAPGTKLTSIVVIGLSLVLLTLGLEFLLVGIKPGIVRNLRLPVYGQVDDFTLTNQTGRAVSLGDLRGRAWLADIIFTRCPGPCLRMSRQMKEMQDALPPSSQARLVSLTTDPDFDTPPVLKTYGDRFGADTNRWMFLTGTKKEIGGLAVGSLKLSAVEKKPAERESADDLFVHSTIFVVVDKRAQLRGIFQTGGEDVDWQTEKQRILAALKQLEREK
jgi:protein SCO1/2